MKNKRELPLDALRGIAALSVLFFHYTTRYNEFFGSVSIVNVALGWLGVPFFFILSGYVIHLTVDRCDTSIEFLKRRFVRLFPTYWICLLCSVLFYYFYTPFDMLKFFQLEWQDVLVNITMIAEWLKFNNVDGAYWSLLPELVFYLIFAVIIKTRKVNSFERYFFVIYLMVLLDALFSVPFFRWGLSSRYILMFMIGISFYRIKNRRIKPLFGYSIIVTCFPLSCYMYSLVTSTPIQTIAVIWISIIILFAFYINGYLCFMGRSKVLVWLGSVSYALYLVHQNIGYGLIYYFDKEFGMRNLGICFALTFTLFLAYLITKYLEPMVAKPLKRIVLKKK